jgi:hypothetical protein
MFSPAGERVYGNQTYIGTSLQRHNKNIFPASSRITIQTIHLFFCILLQICSISIYFKPNKSRMVLENLV